MKLLARPQHWVGSASTPFRAVLRSLTFAIPAIVVLAAGGAWQYGKTTPEYQTCQATHARHWSAVNESWYFEGKHDQTEGLKHTGFLSSC